VKLVINNIPILVKQKNYNPNNIQFDIGIDSIDEIKVNNLVGNVLVNNSTVEWFVLFLEKLGNNKLKKLKSITFRTSDIPSFKSYVSKKLKQIEAAGGLVIKGDKILMIYRLGKWDLPKGKLEKGESIKEAAMREVEEECGVKVAVIESLDETWHTYYHKNKLHLKRTYWYLMECLEDGNMTPQLEEDIEKVEWKSEKQATELLKFTYKNIKKVIKNYFARY